ncbi:hypothetical protein BSG1_20795 [Bacillus sp. SG-1]|nr:hypothetical protein BSG1_20795 [Bacillus sp. SG-1]
MKNSAGEALEESSPALLKLLLY